MVRFGIRSAIVHLAISVLALATAVCSGFAAWYWWCSSRQKVIENEPLNPSIGDNPELHILTAQVDIGNLQSALRESSRLNKIAATWSALAAGFAAVAAILSTF